jgi:ketosteroid isomerase-like protein
MKNTKQDTSTAIVKRHLNSFQQNDLEGVLSDYTSESVFITQEATYTGVDEIRGFFSELIVHFPAGKSEFALDKLTTVDNMVYIVWHAKTPSLTVPIGSDTFIVKDDKIHQQTFVGQLEFN